MCYFKNTVDDINPALPEGPETVGIIVHYI